MALAYVPPSVRVQEITSPNVSPLLAVPASVCILGLSRGYITRTDQIRLEGTTAAAIPGVPVDATLQTVTSVRDALDPTRGEADGSGYVVTTDYTVDLAAKTITRVATGRIPDGGVVNVTYNYLPVGYFDTVRLDDLGSVEQRFGPAYTEDGTKISSPLSYAAAIAFENGAGTVVCQPLFLRNTPGDPTTEKRQPNATEAAGTTAWSDTLFALRDIEDINVLVPVVGQSQTNVNDTAQVNILKVVQDHIEFMRQQDQYIVGVFGEDSSTDATQATRSTLLSHAGELKARYGGSVAQHTVFVSPSRFSRISPFTGKPIAVGGQYIAAGIAGMLAGRSVSASLTRQQVGGFFSVDETRTKSDKNGEAQAGLTVIEQRGGNISIRHSITLDTTSTATRELSVVRAKHRMIESLRDTIDTQIIGQVIADGTAPVVVRSAVVGVLERLRGERDLVDYQNVDARTLSLDPSTVEVRFSYRPAFPLNYVNVTFSLDLTTGDVALS